MRLTSVLSIGILLFISSCAGEDRNTYQENDKSYFEGEIELIESRRIIGPLAKLRITYTLSENRLKREVKYVNARYKEYAGLIIDLENDSITLYHVNNKGQGTKYGLLIEEFQKIPRDELKRRDLSPFDNTFLQLHDYNQISQVEDSAKIQDYPSDYTHYQDTRNFLEQGVFDTKSIKVKRVLLETVFVNLQEEINFPLKSSSGVVTKKGMGIGSKDVSAESVEHEEPNWLDEGIEKLKSGLDQAIETNTSCQNILARSTKIIDFQLPDITFDELKSLSVFYDSYHAEEEKEGDNDLKRRSKMKELEKLKKLKKLDWDD